ncbi:MAG: hypothetical protein DSO04_02645 [Hadesarchaea archaeon]|nr:MAG: hypothetical protein DSO04_02645 [Hadesarchaea archaeon]
MMAEMRTVRVEDIVVPEVRATAKRDEEQEAILRATVEQFGVLNEPIVRPVDGGKYELVAGLGRLTELKRQGKTEVQVKVIQADKKTALMMHLAENLARGSTNPVDEARVLQAFIDSGATVEEAAKITGHTPEWVQLRLALLKLPEVYQQAVAEGKLKIGHVVAAGQLPTPEEMDHCLGLALKLGWTVEVAQNYVRQRLAELEAVRLRDEMAPPPELPEPEKAQEMVRYFVCAGCSRSVDRSLARTPPLCEECLTLLRYVISQLGAPREAMEYLYRAVSTYQEYLRFQGMKRTFEEMDRQRQQQGSSG